MRIRVSHTTSYSYDGPVPYGLQQIRLTPKSGHGQTVLAWDTTIEGGRIELTFTDMNRNTVQLASFATDTHSMVVRSEGEVEVTDESGIVGAHGGFMPLWLFERTTPLTKPGAGCRSLVAEAREEDEELPRLHRLCKAVGERIIWRTGVSDIASTAEDAIESGEGVCQDHAHVFLACARLLGHPARYVSGYLLMEDRTEQEATHAWAEVHVDGLGWVGFDVSNAQSPDARYVRVATGLDYTEASPIHGTRYGAARETLGVTVSVAQVQQ